MTPAARATASEVRWTPLDLATLGGALRSAVLSERFDPFLPMFLREAILLGGFARAGQREDEVVAVHFGEPVEGTSSVFARYPEVVEAVLDGRPGTAVFSERPLGRPRITFDLLETALPAPSPHRFVHPVRLLGRGEMPRVAATLSEVFGPIARPWAAVAHDEGERAFGVESDGELVGVAWASVAGHSARLHALAVRPSARRRGIGSDLLHARLAWAYRQGARVAFSEVERTNLASHALSARAGLRPAGEIYLYPSGRGTDGVLAPLATIGSPRRTDTSAPSSR